MKKLILLLSMAAIGCATPEIEDAKTKYQTETNNCGIIMQTVDSPNGDMIYVKMSYMNPSQRSIYQVPDYRNYKVGSEICNFDGLIKLQ